MKIINLTYIFYNICSRTYNNLGNGSRNFFRKLTETDF